MKSNWRYEVVDTLTVDMKEKPSVVADRIRQLSVLNSGTSAIDEEGLMFRCQKDGCFRLQPFRKLHTPHPMRQWHLKRRWHGPISLRGRIEPTERGTRVYGDIVRDKWYYVFGMLWGVLASILIFSLFFWKMWVDDALWRKLLAAALGVTIFGISVVRLTYKKPDQYHTIKQLKTEFTERTEALQRWDE